MKRIIADVGPFTLKTEKDRFRCLVKSIVSQQISKEAATTVLGRLEHRLLPDRLAPEVIDRMKPNQLDGVGLSGQKTTYLFSLARHCCVGSVNLATIGRKPDDEVIEELIQIKGIGVWTAQMFLIFALGRLDVLPVGDLAIQNSIKNEYGLRKLPSEKRMVSLARPWRPYASIASWYLWRALKP